MKILIVEDDIKISSFLKKGLEEENYSIDCVYDGEEAFYLVQNNIYDLILLDIMIPSINGVDLCKKIREENISYPIIMLTAKSSIEEKVLGLSEGANDYVTKPFSFEELLARIKVQLRSGKSLNNILQIDNLSINTDTKIVTRDNDTINLTSKEYSILEYLVLHKEKVLTEEMINESLLNMDESTASNIVNVYIYRLRNKIDKNYDKKIIHTIRGMGYKISEQQK
ncbi:MAG TPA: response regulator transcription factor [Arcobacter sp.]|nr:response regulator transcription factor [Arcobacter sp.]HIP55503.1 response regulator transcription factor [Arcobacter sp.]